MNWPGSQRSRIVAASIVGLLTIGSFAFGPVVRAQIAKDAQRRGLVVSVDSVSPGWFAINLRGVHLEFEGVNGVHLDIEHARVESSHDLSAQGVTAKIDLPPNVLSDSLQGWRKRHLPAAAASQSAASSRIEMGAVTIDWSISASESAHVSGAYVARDQTGWHFSAEMVSATTPRINIHAASAAFKIDSDHQVTSAHAASLILAIPIGTNEPKALVAPNEIDADSRLWQFPNLHQWRQIAQNIADLSAKDTAEEAHLEIDALSFELARANESLTIGPGKAAISRSAKTTDFEFTTAETEAATPFAFKVSLPMMSDDLVASFAGGPISLSMLGIREGAMGVLHPAMTRATGKGRVVLDATGQALTFDGNISISSLGILQTRISKDPIDNMDIAVAARGVLDDQGLLRLDDADFSLSALHLRAHGSLNQDRDHFAGSMSVDMPAASCQSLIDSLPAALIPNLRDARYRGAFAMQAVTEFDSRKLDDLILKYQVNDGCHTSSVPELLQKSRFTGPFDYTVIDKDGEFQTVTTGPGTESWAALDDISPFMQVAVLTTEDGSFYLHHGFNHNAIRASLIANLKAHRFVRGASTITMQLAKNVFLSREKTLSRKFEEVILADYLEDTFTKQEMMEMYLNVVEFGPDIYGVVSAADHYFGRRPSELNLAESLFLATLLPNPTDLHKRLYEKGELPESWMKNITRLMQVAERNGKISRSELNEGLSEKIQFHKEGDPRPPTRPSAGMVHLTTDDDWDAVR